MYSLLQMVYYYWPTNSLDSSNTMPLSFNNVVHDPLLSRLLFGAVDILEDLVHFLQRLAGRLRDKEERENEGEQTEDGEEGVGTIASVLDERWCDESLNMLVTMPSVYRGRADLQ